MARKRAKRPAKKPARAPNALTLKQARETAAALRAAVRAGYGADHTHGQHTAKSMAAKQLGLGRDALNNRIRVIKQHYPQVKLPDVPAHRRGSRQEKFAAMPPIDRVREHLRKGDRTTEYLRGITGLGERDVKRIIEKLREEGFNLHQFGERWSIEKAPPLPKAPTLGKMPTLVSRKDNTFLIGASGDQHLCFPPRTPITTSDGEKPIRSIAPGDLVLTHKGRYRPVSAVHVRSHNGRFIRIRFRGTVKNGVNDKASLMCTPEHPVLVVRDGVEGFLPAREVTQGDCVRGLGARCKYCSAQTSPWMTTCEEHDPFVRATWDGARKQRQQRHLEGIGTRHWHEDIEPEMLKWQANGYRVIPVDRCRPDFIAIKDGSVMAVEVEAPSSGYRPRPLLEKYDWSDHRKFYDDIICVEVDRRTHKMNRTHRVVPQNEHGFIGLPVTSVESVSTRPTVVYNLSVEEDETYVAKRCVVHNCSRYERLDVLNDLYNRFEKAKVQAVYNTGNWIDGEARFNKHDITVHGMEAQCRYLARHYPARPGFKTYAVAGDDHEGWYGQREGVDIGRFAERIMRDVGREDWVHLGFMEAYIRLVNANTGKSAVMAVVHPGGGSAYALSYSIQKIIEALDGGEKPAVGLYGHYHKLWAGNIRNVWCVQTGTTKDQDPFMRKKKIDAHVGGVIVRMEQDPRTGAIIGFEPNMIRYFNKGYYADRWSYSQPVRLPHRAP
ncbi:MAG: Hint domain-containing protein [Hyphomonadaceae bacterium]